MRFLLDTNVFREIGKTSSHANVATWLDKVDDSDLAISVLTVREVRKGIVSRRALNHLRVPNPPARNVVLAEGVDHNHPHERSRQWSFPLPGA